MWGVQKMFRKRQMNDSQETVKETSDAVSRPTLQHSSAETAHLIGPGCARLVGGVPIWTPVAGRKLTLHPRYVKRIICYGQVDFSTALLVHLWELGTSVAFLSPHGSDLLGTLHPQASSTALMRLQHLTIAEPKFRLEIAKSIVSDKVSSTVETIRYYQRQGKGVNASQTLHELKSLNTRMGAQLATSSLLGLEGQAANQWYRYFGSLLPGDWQFQRRSAHPPADAVNALLSLGYTLATTRCTALLSAYGLDPCDGFLHELRPGRPSLACDLVEQLRVPLVDRLVLQLLARNQITHDSFDPAQQWRLKSQAFRTFIACFESEFHGIARTTNFQHQVCGQIEQWIKAIRTAAGSIQVRGAQ